MPLRAYGAVLEDRTSGERLEAALGLLGLFQMRQSSFGVSRGRFGIAFFALANCLFEVRDPLLGVGIGLCLLASFGVGQRGLGVHG